MDTFGEWLRQQRNELRLTRAQFSRRVGCSVAWLRKIEDSEQRPSAQIAELIANCLNIPPAERSTFVKVARGELRVDRLSPLLKTVDALPPPRINLPISPTPLIGRQREVEELCQLLHDPHCRLLTLAGPGGVGKTRLALEVALSMQDNFADGVFFIPLATANSTRFIVPVIADSIGFAFHHASHADPRSQLFSYLREKQVLLLADNLEHLLNEPDDEMPGIGLLAELLSAAQVKLLATSRETLGLQEEWVFEVEGLAIPENNHDQGIQNTSVELFLQRARRAHVSFHAMAEDYPAIVRICRLVEGNPLGIELAAAWVRMLSCEEIAREIEGGMDFLSGSSRDKPARHRSMRAVFLQSWKLLTEDEQSILLRLAVFRGGFGREAAETVARASLAVLSSLVMKSIIRRSGTGRYDLHELIRQFIAEQLSGRPEEQTTVQALHGRYYLTFFSQSYERLRSSAQHEVLIELTTDMDNFRAAWDWAVMHSEFALIEQTMRTFWLLYDTHGWFQEGLDILGRAINALRAACEQAPTDRVHQVALGHLLTTRAWLAYRLADYEQAQTMLERSLEIIFPLNEPSVLVEALSYLGMLMEATGNYARALELYSEGLKVATANDDRWFKALCLTLVNGPAAVTPGKIRPENAYAGLQSAIAYCRQIGDPRLTAFGLRIFSHIAFAQGRYDEVRAAMEESITLNDSIGFGWGLGTAYRGLGLVAQAQGRQQQAIDMFRKSLDIFTELGGSWWAARVLAEMSRSLFALENDAEADHVVREALRMAKDIHGIPVALEALAGFAGLKAKQGDSEQALKLLSIILNHPSSFPETKDYAAQLRIKLEAQLTIPQVEAALARAQATTFEVVVDEFLEKDL